MIIIELFFILFVVFFCSYTKKTHRILYLLCILLPIHDIIKFYVFSTGGSFFSFWKEIAILIYASRTIKINTYIFPSYFVLILLSFIYSVVGIINGFSIATDLKCYLFPGLLVVGCRYITLTPANIVKMGLCLCLSFSILNFTGVLDFVSPELRYKFRDVWGYDYTYGEDGTVYYSLSSMKILGYERVAGLSSGPNSLGINNSFFLYYLFMIYNLFKKSIINNKWFLGIFIVSFSLSSFCLIFSFSRVGIAILIISILIYLYNQNLISRKIIPLIIILSIIGVVAVFVSPIVYKVFDATFSGNEASSAKRGSMTISALNFLLSHPVGYGLGATYHTSSYTAFHFSELAFINIGIQIGVWGLFVLSIFYWEILQKLKQNETNLVARFGRSFLIAIFIASWVSVNTFQNPFIYLSWIFLAMSCSKFKTIVKHK